jgi:CheY-like chemotaxis protein
LKGFNVSLVSHVDENLWPVAIDRGQMRHALEALLINAAEAMPQGGAVEVRIENVHGSPSSPHQLQLFEGNRAVRITIRDHGRGIPEEKFDRIFDPYFFTKQMGRRKGIGLGLATTYAIIRRHGGAIEIASELEAGTMVTIHLPCAEASHLKQSATKPPAETAGVFGSRVLVMDDEESLLNLTVKMLKRLGFSADTVREGSEAVRKYREVRGTDYAFDAVILDLGVRRGLGGKQTLQELLKIDPGVKAVVCSGYSRDPMLVNFREYGFSAALHKPFRLKELDHCLAQALGNPGLSSGPEP